MSIAQHTRCDQTRAVPHVGRTRVLTSTPGSAGQNVDEAIQQFIERHVLPNFLDDDCSVILSQIFIC